MQIGIFAKTFAGNTPDTVLAAVREAGYGAAQYNMACSGLEPMPDPIPPDVAQAAAEAARRNGVSIVAVSGTYNMIHPDPAKREAGHRRLEVLAARARAMGTGLVTLCTGTRHPDDQWRHHPDNTTPEAWRDLLRAMETALTIAERYDIDLGIEPELANVIDSAAKARRLIDTLQSPRLKIVLDPANLFETASLTEQRRLVSEAVDLLADRLAMAHAKDRDAQGRFVAAGDGVLDYDHYLSCLKRAGFTASLVTHGLETAQAPAVARFLRDKLTGAAG